MGFRQGAFARVFSVENKGKYSQGRISISRKNKETNVYETEFQDGYVRFVGEAHQNIITAGLPTPAEYNKDVHKGITIKINSCDVTNFFMGQDGKVSYTPHYTIFGFEFPDAAPKSANTQDNNATSATGGQGVNEFMNIPDGIDEELPFN